MSDGYSQIDAKVRAWMEANGLTLFDSFAGRSARFCYWSSDRGECFQISIEPPEYGVVRIHAWTIETNDDRELHCEWSEPTERVSQTLDLAFDEVRRWALAAQR